MILLTDFAIIKYFSWLELHQKRDKFRGKQKCKHRFINEETQQQQNIWLKVGMYN